MLLFECADEATVSARQSAGEETQPDQFQNPQVQPHQAAYITSTLCALLSSVLDCKGTAFSATGLCPSRNAHITGALCVVPFPCPQMGEKQKLGCVLLGLGVQTQLGLYSLLAKLCFAQVSLGGYAAK
jgi:hypothetical protein